MPVTLPATGAVVETNTVAGEERQVVDVQGELLQTLDKLSIILDRMSHSSGLTMPDIAGRQRVVVDAITGSLTLGTITTVGTVTSVTGVTTVSAVSNLNGMGLLPGGVQVPSVELIPAQMNAIAAQLRNRIVIS
jgi:hypothetical protein